MSKRKHVSIPLNLKLEALQRLDGGEKIKTVCDELGVSKVTVGDWKRNRSKLEEWNSGKKNSSRSRMRKSEYEKTNEAVFLWFLLQRKNGIIVTGPDLQQKAKLFQQEFKEGDKIFTASDGWLDRWKKRYGIKLSEPKLIEDSLEIKLEEKPGEIFENEPLINHYEGLEALYKALTYIQQQEEATHKDILCMKKLYDLAASKVNDLCNTTG